MRHRGTAVATVLIAAFSVVPAAVAAPVLGASLGVSPPRGVVPATVTVSGSCPRVDDPGGSFFLTETTLTIGGVGTVTVPLDDFGMFVGFDVDVPGGARPGDLPFTTGCGGETSFEVLAAPTLELSPDSAPAAGDIVASGTCPRRSRPPAVVFEGRSVVTAPLDAVTGEFGPVTFAVPDDAGLGPRVVTTSCGGRVILTVLPSPSPSPSPVPLPSPVPVPVPSTVPPTVPPDGALVQVPDLTGLTEAEALVALGDRQLVLANPTGDAGRVARQDPPPLAQVRRGTPVTLVLEAAALEPAGTWSPVVVWGIGLGVLPVLLVLAMPVRALRRRRRERRWLSERVVVDPAASYLLLSDVPGGPVPGLDVELEIRRAPTRAHPQEVGDGRP